MTAASVNISGPRRILGLTPANTSEATIYTVAGSRARTTVVGIYIANLTGSAANATVKWGDGTTDFAVVDTHSIAARAYLHLDIVIPLQEGWTIKVTSGTNSALAFSVVVVEDTGALSAGPN